MFVVYIKLCQYTSRVDVTGHENLERLENDPKGALLAAWHGHILATPLLKIVKRQKYGLISDNRDGDIIARTLKSFGIQSIRGSSQNREKSNKNKGGSAAAAHMRRVLNDGAFVGITPDGPRGPVHIVQPGIASVSIAAQAPILPIALSPKNCIQLKSWDMFLLILPFSRKHIYIGQPIYPPKKQAEVAIEAYRQDIEAALHAVGARHD